MVYDIILYRQIERSQSAQKKQNKDVLSLPPAKNACIETHREQATHTHMFVCAETRVMHARGEKYTLCSGYDKLSLMTLRTPTFSTEVTMMTCVSSTHKR